MIRVNMSERRGDTDCLIDHLIDFHKHKLVEIPSKDGVMFTRCFSCYAQ